MLKLFFGGKEEFVGLNNFFLPAGFPPED